MNFRSSFLENLEEPGSGFGRADLLAALALYDDDPNRINTILTDLDKVTAAEVQQAAKKYLVPANRTSIDRRPGRRCRNERCSECRVQDRWVGRRSVWCLVARRGARGDRADERPAVGPERPFQLAPRVERTLPNGLRVIVTRQTAIPKVSITLTVLSGYSSDPADLTGLASLTADLIQEGTKTQEQPADPPRGLRHGRVAVGRGVAGLHVGLGARPLGVRAAADRPGRRRRDEPDDSRGRGRDPQAAAPAGGGAAEGVAAVPREPRRSGSALFGEHPVRAHQRDRGDR